MLAACLLFTLVLGGCGNGDTAPAQPGGGDADDLMKQVEELNKMVEGSAPANAKPCTDNEWDLMGNCKAYEGGPVCGYDHTVYKDGREQDHRLPYDNACFYCQFYGKGGIREIFGTVATATGYSEGACN